jgi:hypothetical protein
LISGWREALVTRTHVWRTSSPKSPGDIYYI